MPTPGCIVLAVLAAIVALLVVCLAVALALRQRCRRTRGVVAGAGVIVVRDDSHLAQLREQQAEEARPLVVLFHTPWCQYCQRMLPHYARSARELAERYRFAEMDVKEHPQAVAALELEGFPTVVLFEPQSGEVRAKRAGFCQSEALQQWLQQQ